MLILVRSPLPSLPRASEALPAPLPELLQRLETHPTRCHWIVPTGRRCHALLRAWLQQRGRAADLVPAVHTLRSFVTAALEYSPQALPQISVSERLLRVARAWQQVMRRSAGGGLVRQLDRFIRDWQACNLGFPSEPATLLQRVVQRYGNDLEADQRLDPAASLRLLLRECVDPESPLNRLFLSKIELLLLDGFHRLERLEIELIAALAGRCDVLAWLVGVPGQQSGQVLESTVQRLTEGVPQALLIDHVPAVTPPLASLGRRLFPVEPVALLRAGPLLELAKLEALDRTREVEAVAKRIKADYRASQTTAHPLRLSDMAVILPSREYEPLVRELFPRAGLEFHLAGQAVRVADSRPARVLAAALQLVYGHWRHDLLYDFLNLALVKRRLADAHRLHDLFEHRPRARRLLDLPAWEQAWDHYLRKLRDRIARWQSGELALPEQTLLTRAEFVARQSDLANSLERLIESIKVILRPVAALATLVDGVAALDDAITPCLQLLRFLDIDRWLTPQRQPDANAVPWIEYEKDQKAYGKLLGILKNLANVPRQRLPLTADGRFDALGVLQLALDSATYPIKSEEDAGVQLFELRDLRGLHFRHLYVLGLVEGQVPPLPDDGVFGNERRRVPALAEQMQQRDGEATFLFSQLFEAAQDRLVLACPTADAQQKRLPSRFLRAVEEQVPLPALPLANVTVSLPEAAKYLGAAAREGMEEARLLARRWPGTGAQRLPGLAPLLAALARWQQREAWPGQIRAEAAPLLQLLFAEARVFSPSELETYAACPFRYFGSRVLKLEERDPDRTRWSYGSLVHRVFQTFYTELRRLHNLADGEPLPAIEPRHQARLIELFETEWEQLDDGSLPPDLRKLFGCEAGVLHLFFDAIALIEAEHGNLLNEFVLQDAAGAPIVLGEDKKNRPVLLTGKIDRVDIHRRERAQAIILDYKTGRSKSAKERLAKTEDGRMLQLPLYAAALERVRSELRIVGGAYIHLSERLADARKAVAAAGALASANRRAAAVPFEVEGARRLALQLVGEIRDGNFSWTPHPPGRPHSECTSYCEMKHACRHPDGYQAIERY